MNSYSLHKKEIRTKLLAARNALSSNDRKAMSEDIAHHFISLIAENHVNCIFCYAHYQSEVETLDLIKKIIKEKITVCVPYVLSTTGDMCAVKINDPQKDLVKGYKGIPEPYPPMVSSSMVDPELIDIAIVPGAAFDYIGRRIGYGGGYYDRFFKLKAPNVKKVGFAFNMQIIPKVPTEFHDVSMEMVITNEKIYKKGDNYEKNGCL